LILGIRLQLKTVQAIIIATAILHNICRDMKEELRGDDFQFLDQLHEAEDMTETENCFDENGEDSRTRDSLLNNYLAR